MMGETLKRGLSGVAAMCRTILSRAADAADAMTIARIHRAVPEWQLRQVQRDVNRFRRLIAAGREGAGHEAPSGPGRSLEFSRF